MTERIYADTSVIGGAFDEKFSRDSRAFFEEARRGRIILLISAVTLEELKGAPEHVRQTLDSVPIDAIEYLDVTDEARILAQAYLDDGVVGPAYQDDALHIAVATCARASSLVSWNFKHMVNLSRIRGYNSVNIKIGYPALEIRTPTEVLHDQQ
ncbi:MAG: PIN domain protein [Planctomycetes bacterium]|nr:PIN domain protein [Planctomycetota bacterium]